MNFPNNFFSSSLNMFSNDILKKNKFPKNFEKVLGQRCLSNPGNISDLHRNLFEIIPKWKSGIEVQLIQNLAKNKSVLGNWRINNFSLSEFRFGGRFTPNLVGHIGECPHFQLDINPSSLSTNFTALYNSLNYLVEFRSQSRTKSNENILKIDRFGKSSTTSITLYNPSYDNGRLTLGYLKSTTSKIRLGAELFIEWQNSLNISNAFLSIVSSYQNKNYNIAATCSHQSLDLSVCHLINDSLQIGSSFILNLSNKRTVGSIYYQFKSYNDSCVRGMINSDWNVGMTYDKIISLKCGTLTVGLSCLMFLPTGSCITGLMFQLDPKTSRKRE